MNSQKRIIVVLGMHRSGTSAITRALNVLGVDLGDRLLAPLPGVNSKGFFEDIDILKFNIEILDAIGSDWHCVSPIEPYDIETLKQRGYFVRAVELLRKKIANIPVFSFKDPRVAKLLPFWHPVFVHCELDISYLLTIRNPLSIAKSLKKRDDFTHEKSYLLCLGHILTSLTQTQSYNRILIDYDQFLGEPKICLEHIAKQFSLRLNLEELDKYESEFLDDSLRHTVYTPNDLRLDPACPPLMYELYSDLLKRAENRLDINDPSFHTITSKWFDEFERFKSSLRLADQLTDQIDHLNSEITDVIRSLLKQDPNIFRPIFDPEWYVNTYPYINHADVEPYQHYINSGIVDGRFPASDIAHFMYEGVVSFLNTVDSQIKALKKLNDNQQQEYSENLRLISEKEKIFSERAATELQQRENQLHELRERESALLGQLREIERNHVQQLSEQRHEQAERERVLATQLDQSRKQLETQLREMGEREKEFAEELQIIQRSQIQQMNGQRHEHMEREQAISNQLAQSRQQLETLLRELNEREKAYANQLEIIQRGHLQQLNDQRQEQMAKEQTFTAELEQCRQKLETLLHEFNERGKTFADELQIIQHACSQQLNVLRHDHAEREHKLIAQLNQSGQLVEMLHQQLNEREKVFTDHVQSMQHAQIRQLNDQRIEYAAREQSIEERLNQSRQQVESLLRELSNREQSFAEQMKSAQQANTESACVQLKDREDQEKILNARLLAKQEELYQLTQNLQEAERNYAQSLEQYKYQLNAIRSSLTWRWTAPLRSLSNLFSGDTSSFGESPQSANDHVMGMQKNSLYGAVDERTGSSETLAIPDQISMPNSEPTKRSNMSENQSPSTAQTVEELLSYYDEEFIHIAYQSLLGRAPESEGMRYYLARLRSGVSKIEIIAQIHLGKEGRSYPVKIDNLDEVIKRHKLLKIPVIRASLQLMGVKWAQSNVPQRLTAIENKLHFQHSQITQKIDKAYSELSWSLLQIKELIENNDQTIRQKISQIEAGPATTDPVTSQGIAAIESVDQYVSQITQYVSWCILTTPHTLFMAHIIASQLREHGCIVDILGDAPDNFPHDMYVVICPQMFKNLPPGEKRISYQMEQSVSSRWFTPEYLNTLENSRAVLEYSLVNIEFLAKNKIAYPHVHYLPVGAMPEYKFGFNIRSKKYDVLFYGDDKSSPRRLAMLETLKKHFDVRVCSEMFGDEMVDAILEARLVINLHYYENALLEMPRIQECLSLGVPVVSESSQDQYDYPELAGCVDFFAEGDEHDMVETVRMALSGKRSNEILVNSVQLSSKRFAFMFDRFLVAQGFLPPSYVQHMSLPINPASDRIALAMPETIGRRLAFENSKPQGCTLFDGIRLSPGWVGCGLSYSAMARNALKGNLARVTIMEDDVILPDNFEEAMRVVHEYLDRCEDNWDIFSGLVAVLHPEARVLKVDDYKGVRFVTIDKMTSTVCNIYSKKAMQILASWDPDFRDDKTNTIDKYLERQKNLRVVVTLPFMVGHREEVFSSLWGFQNTQYRDLIATSQKELGIKVSHFINGRIGAVRNSFPVEKK